jgi:hypothetical protein
MATFSRLPGAGYTTLGRLSNVTKAYFDIPWNDPESNNQLETLRSDAMHLQVWSDDRRSNAHGCIPQELIARNNGSHGTAMVASGHYHGPWSRLCSPKEPHTYGAVEKIISVVNAYSGGLQEILPNPVGQRNDFLDTTHDTLSILLEVLAELNTTLEHDAGGSETLRKELSNGYHKALLKSYSHVDRIFQIMVDVRRTWKRNTCHSRRFHEKMSTKLHAPATLMCRGSKANCQFIQETLSQVHLDP